MKRKKNEAGCACADGRPGAGKWIRKGDAFVNEATGGATAEFIRLWRSGDGDVYTALEKSVVKPILAERKVRFGIYEGRFNEIEVFAILVDLMLVRNKIEELENPEKLVVFLQCSLRNELRRYGIKTEEPWRRTVIESGLAMRNGDDGTVESPISQFFEDACKIGIRQDSLDELGHWNVERLFNEFYCRHPLDAYIAYFKAHNFSYSEIRKLLGLKTSDNALAQRCRRIRRNMARFMAERVNKDFAKIKKELNGGRFNG